MDPINNDLLQLSDELFQEIPFHDHLSSGLRSRIDLLPRDIRKRLVDRVQDGCSPLFIACREGKVRIVDYLVHECGANIEQKGVLDDQENITPLYCACRYRHIEVVIYLVRMRCNVNALSDNCSTALRIACITTNIEIVQYLIANGADIRKPCSYGITYLSDSVKSTALCRYLISKGADVNGRDVYGDTALHNAVRKGNFTTIQLLLDHGADPYAKNRNGEDALKLACIAGSRDIANYFIKQIPYSPDWLTDAYLLLGSTLIFIFDDIQLALPYWRLAFGTRMGERNNIQRRSQIAPRVAYENAVEFTSVADLENDLIDGHALRKQSFLILERVLGITHTDTLLRLFQIGYFYSGLNRFQTCFDLWLLNLKVRTEKNTILCSETGETARALVELMLYLLAEDDLFTPRFEDVYATFQLLSSNISEIQQLLTIQPVDEKQLRNYGHILHYLCYLIYILLRVVRTENERHLIESSVRNLIQSDVRCALTKKTLLHLSLSGYSIFEGYSSLEEPDEQDGIFPNADVTRFLLECGAPVNAFDETRTTPLLVASYPNNYKKEIVRILVDFGAHLDITNHLGDRPSTLLSANPENDILVHDHITLQCHCANVIAASGIPYRNRIPRRLEEIVEAHSHSSPDWYESSM